MMKVTYISFHEKPDSPIHSGWYIADANGATIGGGSRYQDQASCLRALLALS
ncbi:hypothetical protein [Methylobacterium sp. B1]|uniref:hypothetical protein n=1 Tax=Methylobacterium sp. B1 TaxID=91459 RepID=UPI000346E685|nr:hypothetical protein [Methylobacterium sp. B1]